ncbi:30S ribosomal protein S12 methylthiotransferase RimO [Faecalibaculum rodentium]|jgi:ribosomal protein S12 methylthiotransferase|uniref:Ribosomal protein uS12 methylthiotransferase RimO n=5 Tax=Faecalibaculum rodentium TaxID=1702221 RepID=A0A140DYM4_9FIRM|nr:30S ribosomal protein S12 methylthiotransferase RimO [Faecalibaculum rodentium]AMK55751.1 ribosomal protein S12 methylthiotransferase RimO [Faecalibaculum rodentium]
MKVGFVSLGCCKNLVDSEQIMGVLRENGHEIVGDPRQADAIVINTCGFIQPAKEESINTIFEMSQYASKLIVTGCLAQRYEETLRSEIPEIDAVIPIRDYGELAEKLQEVLKDAGNGSFSKSERALSGNPWSAYVKISDGCSNRCTYCAIPLIRGNQTSKLLSEVREEIEALAEHGVQEVTLIAQDTTKYGLDNYGRLMLADLIREVDRIEGIRWIRILYMYPDEITEEVLQAMKESSKVLPYFDIPMQHASNRLLKLMNRRGTKEDVLALVSRIREMFPEATLRTTAIVGFPTETEEEFQELLDFVKEVRWDRFGAFTYSREEDTPAWSMSPEVDEQTAQRRLDQLMQVQEQISLESNQKKIGQVVEVLVEEREALTGRYRGRSRADAPDEADGQVIFTSPREIEPGTFVNVRIDEARPYDVAGVLAE